MKCSGVKHKVLMDSHSHRKLSNQIDYSSQVSLSKFNTIQDEFFSTIDAHVVDFGERYDITVPGKKIPNWINHQSIEITISFWVGPEFPSIAVCVALHLIPLKDNYANNDKYSSLHDDIIDCVCDIHISIDSRKRRHMVGLSFYELKCDHLWFYGVPHSQLKRNFGDLMQGDHNHVEISCKIDHWASENGKFTLVIARMEGYMWNAYVLLRIPLSSNTILKMLMMTQSCSHFYYLKMVHRRTQTLETLQTPLVPNDIWFKVSSDIANGLDLCLGIDSVDGNGFDLGSASIANPFIKRWLHFQSISTAKETKSDAKKYSQVLFLHWNYFSLEDLIQNNALCIMDIYIYI